MELHGYIVEKYSWCQRYH